MTFPNLYYFSIYEGYYREIIKSTVLNFIYAGMSEERICRKMQSYKSKLYAELIIRKI